MQAQSNEEPQHLHKCGYSRGTDENLIKQAAAMIDSRLNLCIIKNACYLCIVNTGLK